MQVCTCTRKGAMVQMLAYTRNGACACEGESVRECERMLAYSRTHAHSPTRTLTTSSPIVLQQLAVEKKHLLFIISAKNILFQNE